VGQAVAKAICAECAARQECLAAALLEEHRYRFGIRGGVDAKERRQLAKAGRAA
jgi:hypothetical protein